MKGFNFGSGSGFNSADYVSNGSSVFDTYRIGDSMPPIQGVKTPEEKKVIEKPVETKDEDVTSTKTNDYTSLLVVKASRLSHIFNGFTPTVINSHMQKFCDWAYKNCVTYKVITNSLKCDDVISEKETRYFHKMRIVKPGMETVTGETVVIFNFWFYQTWFKYLEATSPMEFENCKRCGNFVIWDCSEDLADYIKNTETLRPYKSCMFVTRDEYVLAGYKIKSYASDRTYEVTTFPKVVVKKSTTTLGSLVTPSVTVPSITMISNRDASTDNNSIVPPTTEKVEDSKMNDEDEKWVNVGRNIKTQFTSLEVLKNSGYALAMDLPYEFKTTIELNGMKCVVHVKPVES